MPSSVTKRCVPSTTTKLPPTNSYSSTSSNKTASFIVNSEISRNLTGATLNLPTVSTLHSIRSLIPAASLMSSILFELVVFAFSTLALFLQLLHIYRTVWWRPQSYTQQAVKLYLINPNVVAVFGLISVPRLVWTLLKTFVVNFIKAKWQTDILRTLKVALITTWIIVYCFLYLKFLQLPKKDSRWLLIVTANFLYPILVYIGVCWKSCTFDALLEITPEEATECSPTNSAEEIRRQIDILRNDFNERLKRVLLQSFLVTYTTTILPCIFTQSYMVYNVYIATEHVLLTFAGSFTLNVVYAFPLKYCTSLHNVAKYLGSWSPVPDPESSSQAPQWCPNTVYLTDAVVTFNGRTFTARSNLNAGMPGSREDLRFFILFGKNGLFQALLLIVQVSLVVVQFVLLLRSTEWHQMISLTLMQAMSCFALFHLVRDCIIARRMELGAGLLFARNVCN